MDRKDWVLKAVDLIWAFKDQECRGIDSQSQMDEIVAHLKFAEELFKDAPRFQQEIVNACRNWCDFGGGDS